MAPQTGTAREELRGTTEKLVTSSSEQLRASDRVGPQQIIDRKEYIRILLQALRQLGFLDVAERLERESGIEMQPPVVTKFQQAVMSGEFDQAVTLLPELTNYEPTQNQARFLILQQKFVEQMNAGDVSAALQTLRHELGTLQINQQELKNLTGCFMRTQDDVRKPTLKHGPWEVRSDETREKLMRELQNKLPPALLIPTGRLEHLLQLAIQAQVDKCISHNCPANGFSLLSDYSVGLEQLPTRLHRALYAHKDEVWHVQFSNEGDRLASASCDCTAIIWDVSPQGDASVRHILGGHPQAVTHLAWSPDDARLLTCSGQQVRIWDTSKGSCLHTMHHHKEHTSACVWFPDSKTFLTSGVDRWIYRCDVQGRVLRRWELKDRVNDVALIAEADIMVFVTADRFIQLMRLCDHVPVTTIGDESTVGPSAITSICLTPDGEYLLANLRSHTGHLWNLGAVVRRIGRPLPEISSCGPYGLAPEELGDAEIQREPMMEYHAGESRVGRYVIRSCIGGLNSAFVACGSEDCKVYIWHRDSGKKLAELDGHSGTVNGVAWNPKHPQMLASASDDRTIGIWMAPIVLDGGGGAPGKSPGGISLENYVSGSSSFQRPGRSGMW